MPRCMSPFSLSLSLSIIIVATKPSSLIKFLMDISVQISDVLGQVAALVPGAGPLAPVFGSVKIILQKAQVRRLPQTRTQI